MTAATKRRLRYSSGERVTSFWPLSSAWQSLSPTVSREVYLTFWGGGDRAIAAGGDYITNSESIFRRRLGYGGGGGDPTEYDVAHEGDFGMGRPDATSDLGVLVARSLARSLARSP